MRLLKIFLTSILFLSTVLVHSEVFAQDYYLWKDGNPGGNQNDWTFGFNWESEIGGFVISNNAPVYFSNNAATNLIIVGGSNAAQRALFASAPGTTTFGSDLRIGVNQTVTGVGAFNTAGYLEVASGTLSIGGSGFLSFGNTLGGDTALTPNRLDITGGQLSILGTSLNLNSTADRFSRLDLTGGTLQVNRFTKSGAGAVAVNLGNGTLLANASANPSFFADLSNTTVSFTGNTLINTDGVATSITVAETLGGTGGFTKIGTGSLTLSGPNTYQGKTIVQNGTLAITSEGNLGATPGAAVADQLTLGTVGTQGTLLANATFGISANRGVTVTGSGGIIDVATAQTLTVNSVITGGASLQKSGNGNLNLTNNNDYTGNTSVTAGTLRLSGASGNIAGNVAVGNTAVFEIARTTALSFGGDVTGLGTLQSNNIGTLALTGTNSVANLQISSGTTHVNGNSSGVGLTSVSAGATLGGSGSVGNVNVSGTLAPGTSIESLGAGNVTFNPGSIFSYELDSRPAFLNGDLLNATGNLNINGAVTLNLSEIASGTLALGTKLTLIRYRGAWNGGIFSGLADDSLFNLGSNSWRIDYNDVTGGNNFGAEQLGGGGGFVTIITAVPEPSSIFLVGIAASLALVRRRRTAV
jgi:fibronectin-binding autotransporter adhesin